MNRIVTRSFRKGDRVILPATDRETPISPQVERGTVLGMSSRTTVMVELDSLYRTSPLDDMIREYHVDDVRVL
jgi:hypothetical protein